MRQAHSPQVVVIGAGLAGLSCAVRLTQFGISTMVLEASDRVGGRVRSDIVDGFTLDHGFQVLATAYPACRELLDYRALRLSAFEPGVLVRHRGGFATLGDPWRRPAQLLRTALAGVGSWGDKLRIAKLRRIACRGTLEQLYERPHQPTGERLRNDGFSEAFIAQFFRPFLGSVFLDPSLETSSRMLELVFRMFATGDLALPAEGMAAIPRQLAERLPRGTVRLRQSVEAIHDGTVHLTSGETLQPATIIVATESTAAAQLVGVPELATSWRQTVTHYFAAAASPDRRRMLMLAGDEYPAAEHPAAAADVIGSVVVPSDVAPQYAPPGKALIAVSTTESADGEVSGANLQRVRDQLTRWFGDAVQQWQHLRSYAVPYALPVQSLRNVTPPLAHGNIVLCGDYCETPSIQGALNSGLRAAEAARAL